MKRTFPFAALVWCAWSLVLSGCADERPAVDITFALTTNAISLAHVMEQTENITITLDTDNPEEDLPYAEGAACGREPDSIRPCPGPAGEGAVTLRVQNLDQDEGYELRAIFTDVQRDLAVIRLEQGGLPSSDLQIFLVGSRGYGAPGENQEQETTFQHADAFVSLDRFATPASEQTITLVPDQSLRPPRVVAIAPNQDQNPDAPISCFTEDLYIEFSRRVRREDALAQVTIHQVIDGVLTPVEFRLSVGDGADEFTNRYDLRPGEDGRPMFQLEMLPGTWPPEVHFSVTVDTGVQDEDQNQLDQNPQREGLQSYTRMVTFECSIDQLGLVPCGEFGPLGFPGDLCGVSNAYECVDGRCVRTSCQGLECAEGEVCSETNYECEPDCRERGGTLFCLPGQVCDEGGFCRPREPVSAPPPGGSSTR